MLYIIIQALLERVYPSYGIRDSEWLCLLKHFGNETAISYSACEVLYVLHYDVQTWLYLFGEVATPLERIVRALVLGY